MGGEVDMSKLIFGFDWYNTVYTDLFDRKTVLALKNQVGFIPFGTSVFYERFYGGGIGDLRGFKFRGVSPREGALNDPVGGDFWWVSTAELNFPIWEELLRGVIFTDVGTVESDITFGDIRLDVGVGVRITLPFFGGVPLAVDIAYPAIKKSGDETQIFSVSLGASF
jgi:outer membrane protein insertion porin family